MKTQPTASRLMVARFSGALLVLSGTLLAGCAQPPQEQIVPLATDGYRTRHPIVVEEGTETIDIPVVAHAPKLSPHLAATIAAFGSAARAQGATSVTLQVPRGSAHDGAARKLAGDVRSVLIDSGLAARVITVRSYEVEGPDDPAPLHLGRSKLVARVQHACGEWPEQATADMGNGDYWNFGCASQANLAAMVDDPNDLVSPPPLGVPDATRRATVLGAYRKGEKTKSEFGLPSTTISSVGNSN